MSVNWAQEQRLAAWRADIAHRPITPNAEYVEHLQNLRRKSNTERNRAKYTRKVKHPKKGE